MLWPRDASAVTPSTNIGSAHPISTLLPGVAKERQGTNRTKQAEHLHLLASQQLVGHVENGDRNRTQTRQEGKQRGGGDMEQMFASGGASQSVSV